MVNILYLLELITDYRICGSTETGFAAGTETSGISLKQRLTFDCCTFDCTFTNALPFFFASIHKLVESRKRWRKKGIILSQSIKLKLQIKETLTKKVSY